jgi:cobyrinic acid a,c-diamide synthase
VADRTAGSEIVMFGLVAKQDEVPSKAVTVYVPAGTPEIWNEN